MWDAWVMTSPWVFGMVAAAAGLGGTAFGHPAGAVPAGSPSVLYEGRRVVDPDGSVRVGFPGVTAHLRFRGSALALRARATKDNFIDVIVDGGAPVQVRLKSGEGSYPLVQGAGPAEHEGTRVRCN